MAPERRRLAEKLAVDQQIKLAQPALEVLEGNNDNNPSTQQDEPPIENSVNIGDVYKEETSCLYGPEFDYFESLPDEILILIFSFLTHNKLPKCSMVCRRWRRIAFDESLWHRTKLRNVTIPLSSLAKLIQLGIRHLDIQSSIVEDPLSRKRSFPKKYKSKLETLDISLALISNRGLAHLLRPSHKLQRLETMALVLSRLGCKAIGQSSELRVLKLNFSRGLDSEGMSSILKGCQKLRQIHFDNASLSLGALNALAANLTSSVTLLSLFNCQGLQDSHVFDIVERCPNLQSLTFCFNCNITKAAYDRARTLKHLVGFREFWTDPAFSYNSYDDDYGDDYEGRALRIIFIFKCSIPSHRNSVDYDFSYHVPSDSNSDDYDFNAFLYNW